MLSTNDETVLVIVCEVLWGVYVVFVSLILTRLNIQSGSFSLWWNIVVVGAIVNL